MHRTLRNACSAKDAGRRIRELEAGLPSSIAHAKHERRGCLTKASNDAQGASHKISNDGALCGMQSYARIAEAHSTMMQTRRAQRLDTDSARRMQSDAYNATKAPNAAQNSKRRATRQTPTHKTARQLLCIRADNADKIRPLRLAYRARRGCTGYSSRNFESELQAYLYIVFFCAEHAKTPSARFKF